MLNVRVWTYDEAAIELKPLPILLAAAVLLGPGNCCSKIVHGSFLFQWPPRCMFAEFNRNLLERYRDILG